jgi:hypothetical protein
MVYSNFSHFLLSISLCKDIDSLVKQYELIRNEYNLARWAEDEHTVLQDEPYHQARMKALWSVMEMIRVHIIELGGQLPSYGA